MHRCLFYCVITVTDSSIDDHFDQLDAVQAKNAVMQIVHEAQKSAD